MCITHAIAYKYVLVSSSLSIPLSSDMRGRFNVNRWSRLEENIKQFMEEQLYVDIIFPLYEADGFIIIIAVHASCRFTCV